MGSREAEELMIWFILYVLIGLIVFLIGWSFDNNKRDFISNSPLGCMVGMLLFWPFLLLALCGTGINIVLRKYAGWAKRWIASTR
jgi:hypothetical protein